MKPGGGGQPSGELLKLINRDFGSFEAFVKEFKAAAATQFGSGWAWLACEKLFTFYLHTCPVILTVILILLLLTLQTKQIDLM